MDEYQTAIRLKPDYAEAHNNLGIIYAKQGRLDEAILEFRVALSLKPDFIDALNNLKLNEAIKKYLSEGKL